MHVVYHNIGALPVTDELGIITLKDLVALIGMSSNPLNVPVLEVMNAKSTAIEQDEPFSRAVQLTPERRVRRLPILSRNKKPERGRNYR